MDNSSISHHVEMQGHNVVVAPALHESTENAQRRQDVEPHEAEVRSRELADGCMLVMDSLLPMLAAQCRANFVLGNAAYKMAYRLLNGLHTGMREELHLKAHSKNTLNVHVEAHFVIAGSGCSEWHRGWKASIGNLRAGSGRYLVGVNGKREAIRIVCCFCCCDWHWHRRIERTNRLPRVLRRLSTRAKLKHRQLVCVFVVFQVF
jgi:hypothetical protein